MLMKFIIQIIACFNFLLRCGTGCVCYNFSLTIDLLCYTYRVASKTVEFLSDKHDNKFGTPNFKISHLIYSYIGEYPEKVRKTGHGPGHRPAFRLRPARGRWCCSGFVLTISCFY